MVTVAPQSLPMTRRKGSYRYRRPPHRYKSAWDSLAVSASPSGGRVSFQGQTTPSTPGIHHGLTNSLMQAAVARLALPRPHLVYIGSTGNIGRTSSLQSPVTPAPTLATHQATRPQRPRRLLDPSVPVRLSPWSTAPGGTPADSAALPTTSPLTMLPEASPRTMPCDTGTSSRAYSRRRRQHHANRGWKSCFHRPLYCIFGCTGKCLPWGAARILACYAIASVVCCGSLFFMNSYLDHVYSREAMRNLLVLILVAAGVFAVTRICRIRVAVHVFDTDEVRLRYQGGLTSPLIPDHRRRSNQQVRRPLRCGDVTRRLAMPVYTPGTRLGATLGVAAAGGVGSALDTDGGDADVEDDPDIEQNRSLVPQGSQTPMRTIDDDDDDEVAENGLATLADVSVDTDNASTSAGTPPPPPYATVVGSSSPPPSYDKVMQ